MTERKRWLAGCLSALLSLPLAAAVPGPDAPADLARGKAMAQKMCSRCHDDDGNGGPRPNRSYPKLAGLDREYLYKQIYDLKTQRRRNPATNGRGEELSAGGTAQLTLSAGAEHAGRLYLVLGSTSGTAPGLPIDDLLLPLNPDAYFQFTLANPGGGVLTDALDFLDAGGQASAALAIPAGANPVLAGSAADHAYVVIDVPGTGALSFASNAVGTELLPEPPRPTGRAPGARQPRSRRPGRSARASCTRR